MAEIDDEAFDKLIDATAAVLALPIAPEWRAGIKANLEVTLRASAIVGEFELPDEVEPAPIFAV